MITIIIVALLIVFFLGTLLGIGLTQAAGKMMPKPTRKINQISGLVMTQAIKEEKVKE